MTSLADAVAPETPAEEERRTSYLELFFDLVFVFAITQVVELILGDPKVQGFLRGALILGLVWWAWGAYAWLTNAVEIERTAVRLAMIAAMAASLFMALAVPDAFGDDGLRFAAAYVTVRLLQVGLYVFGSSGDPERRAAMLRLAPWFVAGPALVLVGGLVDDPWRTWLWAASLVIDVGGTFTVSSPGWRVSPSHFAERYGLFVIIALGESIVAIGIAAGELERDTLFALSVAVAFAGAATLWWAYFDYTALAAERALQLATGAARGELARDVFSILHYPIVLGIILYAVAAKKMVAHPGDPLSDAGRAALAAGLAVYLLGFVLGRYRAIRAVAWERALGAAVVVVAVLVLGDLDAVWLMAVALTVLVAVIVVETVRLRERRAELRGS